MLAHPTHERLIALGLAGMARAFEEQRASPDVLALSFEERVGIMADREAADRDTRRTTTRLKFAALRQNACVEDIHLRTPPRHRPSPHGQARRRRLDRPSRQPGHRRRHRGRVIVPISLSR